MTPRGLWQAAGLALIWGAVFAAIVLGWYAYEIPDILRRADLKRHPAIILEARDGREFARFGGYRGDPVTVERLPPHLIRAFLAVEDRRFYDHGAIDPIGILRAGIHNILAGRVVQGGSTITQQLAKNLFLGPQRTFRRKAQEAMLAVWLERKYTKDEILSAYLNRVYMGSGAWGVDAASRLYFNKPAKDVNLHEAAILAGLPRAPSRYSPLNNPEAAEARARVVLKAMVDSGFISPKKREDVVSSSALSRRGPGQAGEGRYFADWVMDEVNERIGGARKKSDAPRDIIVRTTLDLSMQREAEKRLAALLSKEGETRKVSQAALVTLGAGGAVRVMVGGRDYAKSPFNRAAQARRQPGSAFKPFVYLNAFQNGLTPENTILDAPIRVGKWAPANHDGRYRGPVMLKEALAQSLNTATVRLAHKLRMGEVRNLALRLGIEPPLARDLSLALGTSEVSLLNITGAYASFASAGVAVVPHGVTEIREKGGVTLYRRPDADPPQRVDSGAVAALDDALEAVVDHGTGKRARLPGLRVAGKTGTTQDYRDAWFIGYTSRLVTGIWMGNDDNTSMNRVTGGTLPAGLWRSYMAAIKTRGESEARLSPGYTAHQTGHFRRFLEGIFGGASISTEPPDSPVDNE